MTKRLISLVFALASWLSTAVAQHMSSQVVLYCADLKRVAALATTEQHFAPIRGKPRDGNFSETSLPLTGWKDCSLYGTGTYTCDSHAVVSAQEAEKLQAG